MSAILKGRRSGRRPDPVSNIYVEDQRRRYRVCRHGSRPIMVALKCARGGERMLDINARRARQIIAIAATAPAGATLVVVDPITRLLRSQKGA